MLKLDFTGESFESRYLTSIMRTAIKFADAMPIRIALKSIGKDTNCNVYTLLAPAKTTYL